MARTSKNTIAWHEECWKNRERSNKEMKDEIARLEKMVEQTEERQAFYFAQINEAINQGKDSFDRESFMVKKSPLNRDSDKTK